MPVKFKTVKIAQRAQSDPLLYEILRDMGLAGEALEQASVSTATQLAALVSLLADGDKGDITVSAGGTVYTIDNDVVTYAKMQPVSATARLLGRSSSGAGDVEEITLGTGLSMVAGALTGTVGKVMKAVVYTSGSGTFTTAAGVTEIYVTACAGGGGAGGWETDTAHGGAGGGGGGASVYRHQYTTTGSTGYAYAVGAAGTAGTDSATAGSVTNGGTGGTTSLGALVSLTGGSGGGKATGTGYGDGGAAGGNGGTRGLPGLPVTAEFTGDTAVSGAGGISFPGGYGAGGTRSSGGSANAGGTGYLLIEWNE